MYCSKCGAKQSDNAKFCSNCGFKFSSETSSFNEYNQFGNSSSNSGFSNNLNTSPNNSNDDPSHLAGIASCCFPVVGLILYFIWREEKPNSAKLVCYWMIGGVIVYALFYLISFIAAFNFSYH
ncbi:zinc ribbon domain-containing protein [Clostridium sp.]|uniref:zinc ribbon domain-containing protein n=1 Tax=Clostridium sp. TaxID=1506 RepID=UPI002FC7813B